MRLISFIFGVGLFFSGNQSDNKFAENTTDFTRLDRLIEKSSSLYSGKVVVLVSQRGKLIYEKNIGLVKTEVRPIASASKWLSAAVIMTLVDEQRLSLDDTVGKFLPIFTNNHKGHITIRQLFSHTSGFGDDMLHKFEYRKKMTLQEAVDSIAVYSKLRSTPGTEFSYGGVGMQVGGRIAEIVSGKSWQKLFDEKIGKPCGIDVSYGLSANPIIAGGARTSAEDYLKFVEMLVNKGKCNGKNVISEKAVNEMFTNQTGHSIIVHTPYARNKFSPFPGKEVRYGLGNWLDVTDTDGRVWESSSPGLFGTHPWQDSQNGIAGIVFTITRPRLSSQASLEIRKMVRDAVK